VVRGTDPGWWGEHESAYVLEAEGEPIQLVHREEVDEARDQPHVGADDRVRAQRDVLVPHRLFDLHAPHPNRPGQARSGRLLLGRLA
jgi:hypothetical protein